MAFLGTVMGKLGELMERGLDAESHMLFWGYRGIGHHFPAPSLVAIWAQCQANAMSRRDAVLRVLGEEWRERAPGDLAEEIFRRILEHPEGVEIARLSEDSNLDDHNHFEDKKVRLAPPEIRDELNRAISDGATVDTEYPFVLGSGLRTRWTANTIQRDPGWRKGSGSLCELHVGASDAEKLGLAAGTMARVETRRGSLEMPVTIDKNLSMPGYVWMPNGFGMQFAGTMDGATELIGANCNEITDTADRDPFTGCPHHRLVRVKISAAAGQASVKWTEISGQRCSAARALSVVGDRWTMLVVREAFLGTRRFDDFHRNVGASRNVVADRLRKLVEDDVLERRQYEDKPPRSEYRLTEKGRGSVPCFGGSIDVGRSMDVR